jgi:hypothetical protein
MPDHLAHYKNQSGQQKKEAQRSEESFSQITCSRQKIKK